MNLTRAYETSGVADRFTNVKIAAGMMKLLEIGAPPPPIMRLSGLQSHCLLVCGSIKALPATRPAWKGVQKSSLARA